MELRWLWLIYLLLQNQPQAAKVQDDHCMGIFALPGLILLQPDAGSAITYGSLLYCYSREGYNPVWYIDGLSLLALFILAF
ncbi:MAG: hypothetical protein IPI77_16860 [Saprospiraceae bacterium]|nr:hypothetical protein [Saprospiraceae bacterium]